MLEYHLGQRINTHVNAGVVVVVYIHAYIYAVLTYGLGFDRRVGCAMETGQMGVMPTQSVLTYR